MYGLKNKFKATCSVNYLETYFMFILGQEVLVTQTLYGLLITCNHINKKNEEHTKNLFVDIPHLKILIIVSEGQFYL